MQATAQLPMHCDPASEHGTAGRAGRLNMRTYADLSRKSLFPWLGHALCDWLVIAAALAACVSWPGALTLFASVLIVGNRQHALAILGHDGAHFTLSRQSRINDGLTNLLCFWPLGLTVSGYRRLHFAHHKHTGTGQDPELAHKRLKAPEWDLPVTGGKILSHAIRDLLGGSLADLVILVTFSKPDRMREYVFPAALHLAAASLLTAGGLWGAAFVWYLSLATSFMMFFRLRLWLEHQGTDGTLRVALSPWQAAILAPHNAFYHWEHHSYPAIPYHRLPAVRYLLPATPALGLAALARSFRDSGPIASGAPLRELPAANPGAP